MDHSSLRNKVVAYLAYDDLSTNDSIIDDAIALAEEHVNFRLRVRQMMAAAQLYIPINGDPVELPSDFTEMVSLVSSVDNTVLEYVTPNEFFNYSTEANRYTISGGVISTSDKQGVLIRLIDPTGLGNLESLHIHYIRTVPPLTSASSTNWLIEKSPRVYLYGTLMELQPYLANPISYTDFEQKFNMALLDLQYCDKYGSNTIGRYGPLVRKTIGDTLERKASINPPRVDVPMEEVA